MTDAFEVLGDLSPVESVSADSSNVNPNPAFNQPLVEFSEPAEVFLADEAEPTEAEEVTPNGFVLLGLAPELIQAVADLGYTQPTTVQLQTIPMALPGQAGAAEGQRFIDLMVSSQTGSGKTAAFLLPVLHTLLKTQADADAKERADFERAVAEAAAKGEAAPKRPKRKDPTNAAQLQGATPGALIVCPTRELAQQVAHDAIELVKHCRGLRVANVVGGMPYQLQIAKLQNADLVVATPGRLLDLQRSMQIKLDQVQFLVVDEADRMLDLGFSDDLAEINQLTSQRQQTMMFSATFAPRIQQLAMRVMHDNGASVRRSRSTPRRKSTPTSSRCCSGLTTRQHKRKLLDHWLRDTTINQAIVFASTQIECDGLANDLQQDGFSAVALHGALSQGLRNRRLMALRQGQVQILVATDVAARGIDVPTVTHVFNFGLPMKAEDYTHRIGRTGRAGRDGIAVTFAEFRDRRKIFDIESYSHQHFKAETIPGLEPTQRFPASAPVKFGKSGFGDRGPRDTPSRDRNFGGGGARGGFGGGNADRHVRGGPRQFGANDGGFGQRDERSYDRRSGFNEGFGGGNRNEGFAPRNGGFAPRNESFAPRNESFAPRNEGFAPRKDGFAPRNEGFAPRGGDFAARKPAFSKPGFAKPVRSGKPFTPHGDAPKRSGGTKVLKITRG